MSKTGSSTSMDADEDLRTRWLPSTEQTAAAVAVLQTVPEATRDTFYAVVAIALPGKQFGLWYHGQPVVPVPGVWLGDNAPSATVYPLREATMAAEEAAKAWLEEHEQTGTVSYALVSLDGSAAVFEGILSVHSPLPDGP